jgi:hypothetical protein
MNMNRAGRHRVSLIVLAWYMVVSLNVCSGQVDGGGIAGRLTDPAQGVVVTARVTAKSLETGYLRETITASDGSFRFTLLDAGRYRIEVSAQGFETLIREPITVRAT